MGDRGAQGACSEPCLYLHSLASPVIENGQLQCPQGYKRLNLTHCQGHPAKEQFPLVPKLDHLSAPLFLCSVPTSPKPEQMALLILGCHVLSPGPRADKAISMQQGLCYRLLGPGTCALPLAQRITKQICCCSRVGKAWGSKCEKCPLPGTEAFREICPAGHGYTYSSSDIRLSMRKAEEEELARPSREREQKSNGTLSRPVERRPVERQPLRAATSTWLEAGTIPDKGIWDGGEASHSTSKSHWVFVLDPWHPFSGALERDFGAAAQPWEPALMGRRDSQAGQVTASITQLPAWVPGDAVGRPTPPLPGQGILEAQEEERVTTPMDVLVTPTPSAIDRCATGATNICGPGTCVNLPDGYRCICSPGYRLHPSQAYCTDDNECLRDPCKGRGRCVNHVGSYSCFCYPGYTLATSGTTQECQDVDECEQPGVCSDGRCTNTEGSYHCECNQGYVMVQKGHCQDINECHHPGTCPDGRCVNSPGSYTCLACEEGYRGQSGSCVDVNECLAPGVCAHGTCTNLEGSFRCSCEKGYEVTSDEKGCQDLDECAFPGVCPSGVCTNTAGSFSCRDCEEGYQPSALGHTCEDVDECEVTDRCLGGQCVNTEGSFNCLCETGFQPSPESGACVDIDECEDFRDTVCGAWSCENSPGPYRCVLGCQPGFHVAPTRDCIDVNECELMLAVCGAALCENVEGSFLCLCASDLEEYDAQEGHCRPRVAGGQSIPEASPEDHPPGPIRMECYSGQTGQPPCSSLLGRNTTQAECCCTQGTGWGDACDLCPAEDSVEFNEICPSGKGYVPVEGAWMFGQTTYTDHDECQDMACEDGECVNTEGSFHCFCSPPLTLDLSQQRCVNSTSGMEDLPDHDIHMDICWKKVTNYVCSHPLHGRRTTYTECCCQDGEAWSQQCALCPPRSSEVYAQLCNVARIEAEREAGVHFRPGYEYGPGPEDLHYSLYGPDGAPFYNYLGPEDAIPEPPFPNTASHRGDRIPVLEPPLPPSELQPRYVASHPGLCCCKNGEEVGSEAVSLPSPSRANHCQQEHQAGFEGLQAEECGILNGCENGRCVRVREGYTCDCFEGFQLDTAHMACVDVNECDDLNGPAALCVHGHCENTEGSYRCHCSPGYVAGAGPPHCTAKE
ncbi:Latent-transforming growth factor beta-binding protein 2 [Camelus dromedarius]|uniref:Latent-transforming growth factor beta-binding protein 2 n=1 Tax=Camelus dromedarius TaxID=9838 RepID=A0A5N4E3I8_CAMDR|nr:Latent-transforming growth factor beta-binding protein 2 [Camelus dromedarius]